MRVQPCWRRPNLSLAASQVRAQPRLNSGVLVLHLCWGHAHPAELIMQHIEQGVVMLAVLDQAEGGRVRTVPRLVVEVEACLSYAAVVWHAARRSAAGACKFNGCARRALHVHVQRN